MAARRCKRAFDGKWTPQGAAIPVGALGAMLESGAPADAVAQWQSDDRCQFERDGYLIKAARRDDRVQVAVKRVASASAPFTQSSDAPLGAANATQTTFAPSTTATAIATNAANAANAANGSAAIAAKSALKPAIVEW